MTHLITVRTLSVEECLPIRQRVLWPSCSLTQCRVPDDDDGYHLGICINSHVVGCASLFRLNDHAVRLRKLAILPEHQGQGLGSRLFEALLNCARAKNYTIFRFDARMSATSFYKKRQCTLVGEPFEKKGVPFIRMQRSL